MRSICLDEEAVGFFMWVPDADQRITIWRFIGDKNHQNKGIAGLFIICVKCGRSKITATDSPLIMDEDYTGKPAAPVTIECYFSDTQIFCYLVYT